MSQLHKDGNLKIHGIKVDRQGRCIHYHADVDVLAILFKCCQKYYACFACHAAICHLPVKRWRQEEWKELILLCGHCNTCFSAHCYFTANAACPVCSHPFNPGCKKHWSLYFEIGEGRC